MKIKKGKIAVKKANAIPPARAVRAPFRIPIKYISSISNKLKPDNPGMGIRLVILTNTLIIGIF